MVSLRCLLQNSWFVIFEILKKKQGKLQFILSRKMNIRPMPRINFELDFGLEKAAAVEKALLDE
jgi:ribosome-binding factor A